MSKRKPQAKNIQAAVDKAVKGIKSITIEPYKKMGLASIIITNIYKPTKGTEHMLMSFQKQGHEVAALPNKFEGNGVVLKHLYECYKRAATGHELFVYSDGADTFCQRPVFVPTDHILYSVEKNCYPKVEMAVHFPGNEGNPFKYLNGGGYGGPLKLIIEFFEKYGLTKHQAGINGQHEQMVAYLAAKKDGFPIELDLNCEVFQTTAFTNDTELEIIDGLVHNKLTGTIPAILHGNGTSDMEWIYKGGLAPDSTKALPNGFMPIKFDENPDPINLNVAKTGLTAGKVYEVTFPKAKRNGVKPAKAKRK